MTRNIPPKKEPKAKQRSIRFEVKEAAELMQFLVEKMLEKGMTTIKSFLKNRQVSVNNQIVSQFNHLLEPGQMVMINLFRGVHVTKYPGLKIIFEDDAIIVIEKEEGLLSIANEKERQQTAFFILMGHVRKSHRNNRVHIVHRLDREASGIMVFAKSVEVQECLQQNWNTAVIERKYIAVVEGKVKQPEGTIVSWLKESKAFVMYSCGYDNGGQKAVSHYRVMKSNEEHSLLEINLETGQENQIRVHMQVLGHSIIGDKKYGAKTNPIRRMGLHALSLSFKHPVTGKEMRFETSVPKKFLGLFLA